MSLRARLVVVVVVVNLAVVAVVQIGSVLLHREQLRDQREVFYAVLQGVIAEFYPAHRPALGSEHDWVRDLLRRESFRRLFRDVMFSSGAPAGTAGNVDINPMGAAHRDPRTFSAAEIRRGIRRAKELQQPVPVAGGFCVPIAGKGSYELGAWYVPLVQPELLPLGYFALPVLASTALLGVLAYLGIQRSVTEPLGRLGAAAARVGAGDYTVRLAPITKAPELNVVVDAFNAMAAKVAGHTQELAREVEHATEEAARRERALLVSSRLAAMGTLAAGIAHEINNPIAGMMNAAHRLGQLDRLDGRGHAYVELIREGLERVSRIARQVLDFSPRRIQAAPFRIQDVVAGAWALVEHRRREVDVVFETSFPADLPLVDGDRHEVQQVLLNCFLNALDALGAAPRPRRIAVRAVAQGDLVEIHVRDNGRGADPQTLARALDPFFSTKEDPTASGLGLFISYSIVRNHGGRLEVDARPGEGFHVLIALPASGSGTRAPLSPGRGEG